MEGLTQVAVDLLVVIAPILVTGLSGILGKWILNKSKNESVKTVLTKLNHAVWTVVLEIEETMVKEYKKANADGTLSDEEKEALKKAASDKLKSYLSFKEISRVFGLGSDKQAAVFVASKVEAAVNDMKKGAAPVDPS